MKKTTPLIVLATLAVSLVVSAPASAITNAWSLKNLVNSVTGRVTPIWPLLVKGTTKSVKWKAHPGNPRFQIFDPNRDTIQGNTSTWADDMVLDRETGLIWERVPSIFDRTWAGAKGNCYYGSRGARYGWRLPAIEELGSLMDAPAGTPNDGLAAGHPFEIVMTRGYWSSTTSPSSTSSAYALLTEYPEERIFTATKTTTMKAWCVRGGVGQDVP